MTLREAVDVIDCDDPDPAQRRRARAIVDAAVEAHERFCAWQDTPYTPEMEAILHRRTVACDRAARMLRALERGEDAT
jgi:hypothetical protein